MSKLPFDDSERHCRGCNAPSLPYSIKCHACGCDNWVSMIRFIDPDGVTVTLPAGRVRYFREVGPWENLPDTCIWLGPEGAETPHVLHWDQEVPPAEAVIGRIDPSWGPPVFVFPYGRTSISQIKSFYLYKWDGKTEMGREGFPAHRPFALAKLQVDGPTGKEPRSSPSEGEDFAGDADGSKDMILEALVRHLGGKHKVIKLARLLWLQMNDAGRSECGYAEIRTALYGTEEDDDRWEVIRTHARKLSFETASYPIDLPFRDEIRALEVKPVKSNRSVIMSLTPVAISG